jgi:hypothetical protein
MLIEVGLKHLRDEFIAHRDRCLATYGASASAARPTRTPTPSDRSVR